MQFFHISDLHIGKVVKNRSMLNEQKHILSQIISLVKERKPDAMLIAGDVFDSEVPPVEAVEAVGGFFTELSAEHVPTIVIAGNHDSAERLSFCSEIIRSSGVYIAPAVFRGSEECEITPIRLCGRDGVWVNFYPLPFVTGSAVERYFHSDGEEKFSDSTEGMRAVISSLQLNKTELNVLITHLFICKADLSGAEERYVGTLNAIGADVFDDFDYVALGHIHRPQSITDKIRYSGSPLKYSNSECGQEKSLTVVELNEKGKPIISAYPLSPLNDMCEIKGTLSELTDEDYAAQRRESYVYVVLTDSVPGAGARLTECYPLLMGIRYEEKRAIVEQTASNSDYELLPLDIFTQFFKQMKNDEPSEEQKSIISELISNCGGKI